MAPEQNKTHTKIIFPAAHNVTLSAMALPLIEYYSRCTHNIAIRSVFNALSNGGGLVSADLLSVEILCSILKHQFFNVVAGLLCRMAKNG